MARIRKPETAGELVTMLEEGQIDIFDALEYAPPLAADRRRMSQLKQRMKCRTRARDQRARKLIEEKGESDVQQTEE